MAATIQYRKQKQVGETGLFGLTDLVGNALSWGDQTLRVFCNNPFADDPEANVQLIGVVDDKAVGTVSSLPLDVSVDGKTFRTAAGSAMRVDENFRNTQFGLKLPMMRLGSTPNNFMIGSSQSQMMIKVSEFIKSTIFYSPRLIMLAKSRSVVEMKVGGWLGKIVAVGVDFGLWCYWMILGSFARLATCGYVFEVVKSDDDEGLSAVAKIAADEPGVCREVHDAKWFRWMITESFSKDGPNTLWLIKKDGAPVAFVMSKRRFHEQASHRGFKNVWLASVMEWGTIKGCARKLPALILRFAARIKKGMDAVEIIATETRIESPLRWWLWRHVGDGNFVFKVGKGSPLEPYPMMHDRKNWRLRPAMGDAGFN